MKNLRIVVLGLSVSSSWGNGHATTYRALLRALAERGHEVLFLERDAPWYAAHRDLPNPDFCQFALYQDIDELPAWQGPIKRADIVIIGSYVPQAVAITRMLRPWASILAFYDIDTPVTLARVANGDCDYLTAATIPTYDIYLSFTAGPTLNVLERRYGARAARPLFCAVDPARYRPAAQATPPKWALGYLGTYSPDRQPALEQLLLEPAGAGVAFRRGGTAIPGRHPLARQCRAHRTSAARRT